MSHPQIHSPLPRPSGHAQVSVANQDLRAAWFVRHTAPALPQAAVRSRAVGGLLLVSVANGVSNGYLDAQAHGGQGFCCLGFQLQGAQRLSGPQGVETTVNAGDTLLWHSQMSGDFLFPVAFHELLVLIPMAQALRDWPLLPQASGPRCLAGRPVLRAMALAGLQALWQQPTPADEAEDVAALNAIVDLVHRAERPAASQRRSKADLHAEILRHIERELDNPTLDPASLAQRFNCSVRGLHALFAQQGQTVAGHIRQRRLARCRDSLADPRCHTHLGELAVQWGFSDAAHFSKLFKAAYGQSPSAFRSQARA